jgi:heterodisulfide reductase subunit C
VKNLSFVKLGKSPKNIAFRKKVMELAGEDIKLCYQCGECSGGCPESAAMDLLPNQVMHKIQLGDDTVLDSNTYWICSSCLVCSARCPKGIDIAKTMEALREISLRAKKHYVELEDLTDKELEELPQIALVSSFKKQTS